MFNLFRQHADIELETDDSLHLERGGLGDTEEDLALVPELGETSLRSLSFGVKSLGDAPDLGLHTGVYDNDSCSTFGNLRSGEDETDSVTAVSVYSMVQIE